MNKDKITKVLTKIMLILSIIMTIAFIVIDILFIVIVKAIVPLIVLVLTTLFFGSLIKVYYDLDKFQNKSTNDIKLINRLNIQITIIVALSGLTLATFGLITLFMIAYWMITAFLLIPIGLVLFSSLFFIHGILSLSYFYKRNPSIKS
jgi:hypothetical protein